MKDGQRISVDGFYLNADYDLDFGKLTSVTGWRRQLSRIPNSYAGAAPIGKDGTPLSFFDATRDDNRKTFQQELRFATNTGTAFDAVIGGFYQRETVDFCVAQILGFLDLTAGPLPFGNWNDTPYILCNAQRSNSKAVFAEGTYKITPELSLTGGMRYTWEDKTWYGRNQAFIPQLGGGFDPSIKIDEALDASVFKFPANVVTVNNKSNKPTWRVTLGYQATPDIFAYANYSRGFKSGGFNDQIGGFAAFATDLNAFRVAARATRPETADSFEVGVKTELWDHRLRFNLTGFYVKYKDLQKQLNVPIVVNGNPNQVTLFVNAASATVKGIRPKLPRACSRASPCGACWAIRTASTTSTPRLARATISPRPRSTARRSGSGRSTAPTKCRSVRTTSSSPMPRQRIPAATSTRRRSIRRRAIRSSMRARW